jgi:hypothetical protein
MNAKAINELLLLVVLIGSITELRASADLPFIYNDGPAGTYTHILAASFNFKASVSTLDFNFTVNIPGYALSPDTFNCTGIPYTLTNDDLRQVIVNTTGNTCLNRLAGKVDSLSGGPKVVGPSLLRLAYTRDGNSVAFSIAGKIINMFNPDNSTVVTVPTGLYLQAVSSIWVFDPVKDLVSIDMNISLPNLPVNPLFFNCRNVPYYPTFEYTQIIIDATNNDCIASISHLQQFSPGEPLPIHYDFAANVLAFSGFFDNINMGGSALPPTIAPTTAGPTLAAGSGPNGSYSSAPTSEQRMQMTFNPSLGQMRFDITLGYTGYNQASWNCSEVRYYMTSNNVGFNFTNNSCFSSLIQYYQSERDDGTDVLLMTYNNSADTVSLGGRLIAPAVVMSKDHGGRRLMQTNFAAETSTTSGSSRMGVTLAIFPLLVLIMASR